MTTATTTATHFPRSAAVRGPTSDSSATLPHRARARPVLPRLPSPYPTMSTWAVSRLSLIDMEFRFSSLF